MQLMKTTETTQIQVFSSHDAVNAIAKFSGDPMESVSDWIKKCRTHCRLRQMVARANSYTYKRQHTSYGPSAELE
jgi:hypothetical protein